MEEQKLELSLSAPESAHQQWGGRPHRTEHWLSVAEGNCVAERRGGEQPEANDQSIIKKMMNSIFDLDKAKRNYRVGISGKSMLAAV